MELFRATGDNPFPRFGHTITCLSQNKIVLYGGATGDVGKYTVKGMITNLYEQEMFLFLTREIANGN